MRLVGLSRPVRLEETATPLALTDVKQRLRITDTVEDADLAGMIASAWEAAETFMERTLLPSRYSARFEGLEPGSGWGGTDVTESHRDWFTHNLVAIRTGTASQAAGSRRIELPRPPLLAVEALITTDGDGITTPIALEDAWVDTLAEPGIVILPISPALLTVTFTAGYADAAAIPRDIYQGLMLEVGSYYAHREDVADLDETQRSVTPLPGSSRARDHWGTYRITSLV